MMTAKLLEHKANNLLFVCTHCLHCSYARVIHLLIHYDRTREGSLLYGVADHPTRILDF